MPLVQRGRSLAGASDLEGVRAVAGDDAGLEPSSELVLRVRGMLLGMALLEGTRLPGRRALLVM